MKKLLVTGSSGLTGSEVCLHFAALGWQIHGVDNNQRAVSFGSQGHTRWNQQRLQSLIKGFVHHEVDSPCRIYLRTTSQKIHRNIRADFAIICVCSSQ